MQVKGAVAAMSRQAATEWAKYQVRCNAVAPGGVMTEAMKKMEFPSDAMDQFRFVDYLSQKILQIQ